ncbi:MAG: PAS domain-containing protein [Chitinophagaceae bacterium]|nr:PAS domain-containing protein [Chitinophagaceae bacterium]
MSFYKKATIGFCAITLLAIGMLYFVLPYFGTDVHPFYSGFFISLVFVYSTSTLFFIYRVTKRFAERTKAERAITEQLMYRYQSISNATNDAIWDYDLVTGKVYYNSYIQHIFGYTSAEMAQNDLWWEQNIHSDDVQGVVSKMDAMLASNKNVWQDEYRFRCKNGAYKLIYDRSFIVRNGDDYPVRLIGSMIDITDLREKQEVATEQHISEHRQAGIAVVKKVEEERKKWRYLLHEDISQILAAAKMHLYSNNKQNQELTASIRHIETVIKKVNELGNEIRPALLDHFGLVDTVSGELNSFSSFVPVLIDFKHSQFNRQKINDSVALLLHRIIKEQAEYVIANTNASAITIELKTTATGKTALTITDNRIDKRAGSIKKDLLMEEIKNHVKLLNGSLKVFSDELQGQTLLAEV